MTWRQALVATAVSLGALALAAVAQSLGGRWMADRLTPRDLALDRRVVVIAFEPGLGELSLEVPHLRATYYRDIAVIALRRGADAIAYLDFDSLTFSDGASGRANVIDSEQLQTSGVGALHDPRLETVAGRLPYLSGYRVDPLASELAGIGIASAGGSGRTLPALVRVSDLTDGVIVDVPGFAGGAIDRNSNVVVPGLALRLAEKATGATLADPTPSGVMLGDTRIPLDDGRLRVAWSDELDEVDDERIVPVTELRGSVPDGLFDGAVVLVGTVDPSKTEYIDTPVGPLPEVIVQANALNTLFAGRWVRSGSSGLAWIVAVIGVVAVLAVQAAGRSRHRRWWPSLVTASGVVALWSAFALVAADRGTLLDVLPPVVACLAAALLVGVVLQVEVFIERRRLRALFAQYVPATVAEQLVASGRGEQASAGERVAITALFCDLRGFTPIAARLEPAEVRALLNVFYDVLSRAIFDSGGTVLQYTGDEIFAVFGAPLPDPDHASTALGCARRLFEAQRHLNDELLGRGLPPLNYGIGLHSGDAIAAHVGSSVRMQYSVIGDTVNVASRHCSLAREGQIVVSATTAALVGGIDGGEALHHIQMKGIDGVHEIHRIQAGPAVPCGAPSLAGAIEA
jgi:adenylate cyclase